MTATAEGTDGMAETPYPSLNHTALSPALMSTFPEGHTNSNNLARLVRLVNYENYVIDMSRSPHPRLKTASST